MKNSWSEKQFKKSDFRGDSAQWEAAAKSLETKDDDLSILGLNEYPTDLKALQKARNQAMLKYHPDRGGTTEQAQAIQAAFERLKTRFG